jgi:hypothetical protein
MRRATAAGIVVVALMAAPDHVCGERIVPVATDRELQAALADAASGDVIRLAPGTYRGGLHRDGLQGTEGAPIVVEAADPQAPPEIHGRGSCIHLSAPAFIELRNLVLSGAEGNGLNIDDGGSKTDPAHHVTLTGLVVRDVGPRGNCDALKLSGLDSFIVQDCTIERWGDGGSGIDMVGCHDGVVKRCTFRDGADGANGVQTKGGSRDITIQRCRFESAGGRAINVGGSTGLDYFRPQPQGFEAQDITVEDCTFIGSMTPIAFVGVDGATVRYNTIYRPTRWLLRILQENQDPAFVPSRNGRFEHNVVAFRADEVRTAVNIGGGTAPETFTFAGNAWYCIDRPDRTRRLVQLPTSEADGVYGTDPQFTSAETGDLHLTGEIATRAGVRPERPAD